MSDAKKTEKKAKVDTRNMLQKVGFYMALVYSVLTVLFLVQMFLLNVVPEKYALLIAVVLTLLMIGMMALQVGKKVNQINRVLGKILIIILSCVLGFGNYLLFNTGQTFSKLTQEHVDTTVVSVVVMKDSPIQEVSQLNGELLGILKIGDLEKQNSALSQLEKEMGSEVTYLDYDSYEAYGNALYNGEVSAILLNEGARGLFEDFHANFDEETRVVKEYVYQEKVENIAKDVNVSKDVFNIYITGIDTYGTLSTVSRSDVNMIITVNPKTHQILMTGIPRDFYIPQVCQGNQKDKLTHTGLYGVDCTVQSMENYTGLDINYYARVNFSSVVDIVDALGGIQVWSDVAFTAGAGGYSYVAGLNDLNGAETLGFVRERHSFGDGDRERSRNQMKVVEAMINKAISPAIIKNFAGIMDAVAGSFQTNMSQSDITKFVKNQIESMEGWDIMQIQVNGTGQSLYSPANGGNAYMMVPNVDIVNSAVALIEKMQTGVELTQEDIDAHMYVYNNGGY